MFSLCDLRIGDCVHCESEEEAVSLFQLIQNIDVTEWVTGELLIGSDTEFSTVGGESGIYYYFELSSTGKMRIACGFPYDETGRLFEFSDLGLSKIVPIAQSEGDFMEMIGG